MSGFFTTSDVKPDADVERVREWVREFSVAMSMPGLLAELDKIIARHAQRNRGSRA